MDEHHWCTVLPSLAGHLSGPAHCCNRSLLLVEVKPALVLLQWSEECLYLQTEPNFNVPFTSLKFTSSVLRVFAQNTATLIVPVKQKQSLLFQKREGGRRESPPEEGVIGVIGVAMMPLALSAAICCICTAATVATGDKYADWATSACCWTSCGSGTEDEQARVAGRG